MLLEAIKPGLRLEGLIPAEVVTVLAVQHHGADALELTVAELLAEIGRRATELRSRA